MVSHWKNLTLGLFSILVLVFAVDATAQQTRPRPLGMGQPPTAKGANETYSIVEIDHEYQIVPSSGMKDLKKRLKDEFKTDQKNYQNAKKDKTNKGIIVEPKEKTVKEVKKGIKTQEKAQDELQKLQAERDRSGGDKRSRR
jgi:hypothetical protein